VYPPARRTIVKVFDPAVASPSPAPLSPWYGRVGLLAMLVFLAAGLAAQVPGRLAYASVGALVATAGSVELFIVRRLTPAVSAAFATFGIVLVANGSSSDLGWFAVCIIGGWSALRGGVALGLAVLTGAALLFGGEWLLTVHDPGWGAWIAGTAFTVLAALLVRHQLTLVERMRALQADLAQRERADERTRIARELHDVIAHGLTVSLLHVASARLAVEHDPADAARALAEAERLTRRSLDDVRATVGMLHSPGDDGLALPAPRLADLTHLVDDLRVAQADVSLVVHGDLDGVPATTGTTVYRIVQESLTNASRHAAGASVTVCVDVRSGDVYLSIESDGAPGTGTGMGLLNMKQRADAVGGTLTAGPGGSGWLVTASFPRVGSGESRS
jgi:signal transduction histidine kinase